MAIRTDRFDEEKKEDVSENVVTYETFRKFQKQERDSEKLQKLPDDFYKACADWIKRKSKIYEENKDSLVLKEIENVMAIIKDILDRRERKILTTAMHAVRSGVVPKNLLGYEAKLFDVVVGKLKKDREEILNIIKGHVNEPKKEEPVVEKPEPPKPKTAEKKEEPLKEAPKEKPKFPQKIIEPKGYKLVRILDSIPQFMGTGGRTYGPFKSDDMITLEEKIANLLVTKNKAEFCQ